MIEAKTPDKKESLDCGSGSFRPEVRDLIKKKVLSGEWRGKGKIYLFYIWFRYVQWWVRRKNLSHTESTRDRRMRDPSRGRPRYKLYIFVNSTKF